MSECVRVCLSMCVCNFAQELHWLVRLKTTQEHHRQQKSLVVEGAIISSAASGLALELSSLTRDGPPANIEFDKQIYN